MVCSAVNPGIEMLTRALLVLLGVGLVASAANRDMTTNDNYNMGSRGRPEINQTKIFCYLNATRIIRNGQFRIEHLNVDMCTHIVYGAAFINSNNEVEPVNHDLERGPAAITFAQLAELKRNKNVKIILSIHGSHHQFSSMARGYRTTFVTSVSQYLSHHEFDGVNIDWQYPGKHGGNAVDDKQNYNLLIQELKSKIRGAGRLLTVSLPPTQTNLVNGFDYDNDNMLENVDYWFIMAIEYYNHMYATIGANAPIIGNDGSHDVTSTINFIKSKDRLNRDSLKLILVIPFYGKQYALDNELRSGESPIGQRIANRNSAIDTVWSYRDVCADLQKTSENWIRGTDRNSKTPYAVSGKKALLFEDPASIAEKTNLALKNNLGGVMAFSLDLDDFDGTCANDHGGRSNNNYNNNNRYNQGERSSSYKYPLLQAMYDTVQRGPNGSAATAGLSLFLVASVAALLTVLG